MNTPALHQATRRRMRLVAWVVVTLSPCHLVTLPARAADDDSEARMRRDITVLASDAFEGRGVTTRGVNLAADYVADAFRSAGLKPAGKDGGYFQPFTIPG